MNAKPLFFLMVLGPVAAVSAQQSLPADFRLSGREVTSAFDAQRSVLQTSSAVILDGRREIGYGVVVTPDGHVLAKASELAEAKHLSITVDATRYKEVQRVAEDPVWDVALLKIPATGLTPVRFSTGSEPAQGTWVVSNGATTRTHRRALAGIISAKPREIPAADGVALGISFKDETSLKITGLADQGGAKAAGIKEGDIIVAINGRKITSIKELSDALKELKAGNRVSVTCMRETAEFTAEVQLNSKAELFSDPEMMDRNDMMSGEVSHRRSGFPRIIQHDTLSSARIMGGPLINLDGECIGMNIARANRCENFAIPSAQLQELTQSLLRQANAGPAGKAQ